ncbi:hypothetical protein F4V91_06850 [Neorhizobium galegae]|uniref:Uncharacterized protein n=1 Tax=Neorhizobium galegae TaxID=399 RepID=A0A6A1TTD5_NEOGA|nr:hypothetical protein [Neorhizobium galegae]KAB1086177.1 hypothetical protein F4V91_06850 [Neorhizobium galegae]
MKEVIQEIHKVEDRELRWLVRYEQLIAWHRSGGVQQAVAEYHAQIAKAEHLKAIAELRVAQIAIIETTISRFDGKAVRNAQIVQVAAQHRADAAERQAIQEACDEIIALEEIVPADDIDDILSQFSSALGIELPTDSDRTDICQLGYKSMADLKRELGPSLWSQCMVSHEKDQFQELAKTDRFAKLIQAYSTSVAHYHLMKECADEPLWISSFDHMIACRNRLYDAVATLRDHAVDLEAKQTSVRNDLKHSETDFYFKPTEPRYSTVGSLLQRPFSRIEKWTLDNFDVLDDSVYDWIDRNKDKPEWADDVLDGATLDSAWKAVTDQFDAGRTLEQLGWSPPSDEPPDPPHGVTSIAEVIRRAAA